MAGADAVGARHVRPGVERAAAAARAPLGRAAAPSATAVAAAPSAGEGLDLIHAVQPVRTIVDDMLADARKALADASAAASAAAGS